MLRDLTRYRADLIGARTAEKQRVEKLLEDAQIKVSVVASDIFGVSGRAMLAALIAGERDPETLADLARGRMRRKTTQLREAFIGRFTEHHAFLLTKMLARIDQLGADIEDVEERTNAQIAPFASAVVLLDEIPGIGVTAAQAIIAEIGVDMTRFPTPAHLSSWAKFAPGIKESAGRKKGNGAAGHGNQLPGPSPGRGRRLSWPHRHLPRRALPTDRPTTWQAARPRRGRPLHPGHHLAPPRRARTPSSTTSAPTTTTPASTSTARCATTSVNSKHLGYRVTLEPAA